MSSLFVYKSWFSTFYICHIYFTDILIKNKIFHVKKLFKQYQFYCFLLFKKPISITYFVCISKHNKAADISSVNMACCVINCKLKETVKFKPKTEEQLIKWKDAISYRHGNISSMKETWCMNWRETERSWNCCRVLYPTKCWASCPPLGPCRPSIPSPQFIFQR